MPRRRSPQFSLAELVMLVILSGLVLALFSILTRTVTEAPGSPTSFLFVVVAIEVSVVAWTLIRLRRKRPTCEECGRRFIATKTKTIEPIDCPRCGRQELGPARSAQVTARITRGLIALLAALVTLIGFLLISPYDAAFEPIKAVIMLVLFGGVFVTLLAIPGLVMYQSFSSREPGERTCAACGAAIPAERITGPLICPQCRLRHLRREEAKREQARGLWILLACVVFVAFASGVILSESVSRRLGLNYWMGILLVALGTIVALFIAMVVALVVFATLRRRKLQDERSTLAMVRKCAGQEGEVVKEDQTTIWYSGQTSPVPMILEQRECARGRFDRIVGEGVTTIPPLRIFVFHERRAFSRFHVSIFGFNVDSLDGVYLPRPFHMFTLCTDEACRVTEPARTVRSLHGYPWLEAVWGPQPPPWLQLGVSRAAAFGGDRDAHGRLNRKMIVSLSRETSLGTELFRLTSNDLTKLFRGANDHRDFQKSHQFHNQSWSIVEYLCGEQADEQRKDAFRAFLQDGRSKTHQEESFQEHFGIGFAPMLDGWRQWVLDQGIGPYEPAPPEIRDALLNRVLPVVRDRRARRGDRILAIRELGGAGYLLGADALIELLREHGEIPNEEIVWSLEMISGLVWGDDPDRWQAWWDDLPMTWSLPQSDGSRPEPIAPSLEG